MPTLKEPTLTTVPLSALNSPTENPRTVFHQSSIEGLAASILQDGLLQNLVVTPIKGKSKTPRYRIISGDRRFRALTLLSERGALSTEYPIPVEIRAGIKADEALRLATVENVQREKLPPMDEAEAFAKLVQKGESLEEVAIETGCSPVTVRRRLALASLSGEVQDALREGSIGLAQAEALTLATHEKQPELLEESRNCEWFDAEAIRKHLLDGLPSISMAIFPLDQYDGTLTGDLFAEDETTYFDDEEKFMVLQSNAVDELVRVHEKTAAWVERTERYSIPTWQYEEANEGEPGGVVINLSPNGTVEVLENLMRHEIDEKTAGLTAETPLAPTPKATYNRPLCRVMAYQKSLAVQATLLTNPRTAKILTVLALFNAVGVHDALTHYHESSEPSRGYTEIESIASGFLSHIPGICDDGAAWLNLLRNSASPVELYEAVKALSDSDLDVLLTLLTAMRFGQSESDTLDTGESLFNHVALDLGIQMREHWTPDREFLSRRTCPQLAQIAAEVGAVNRTAKKADLVEALIGYFTKAKTSKKRTEQQQQACDWLPDAMQFPAINPDLIADEPS